MKYLGKITDNKDLVTKEYVDNKIGGKVNKSGDTMTGNLVVPATRVANTYYGISFGRTTSTPVETILYTGIKWVSSSHMPVIHITGYAYGLQSPVEFKIGFYIYNGNIGYCGVTNMGSWAPDVYLFKYIRDTVEYVAVGLAGSCYFLQLQADVQDEMGKFNNVNVSPTAWSWSFLTTAGTIPTPDSGATCIKVPYKANILKPAKADSATLADTSGGIIHKTALTTDTIDGFHDSNFIKFANITGYSGKGLTNNDGIVVWIPYNANFGQQYLIDDNGYHVLRRYYNNGTWAEWLEFTSESKAAASGGTAVSLVTTGEKYTWNNKQNALTNPVTGTGTSGYLAKFNGTSTITSGLEYDDNGHLGLYNNDYGIEYSDQGLMLFDSNDDYLIEPWALVTDSKSAASGGTDLSLVSTGEKYNWNNKQDVLESGTNIKTINNTSLLGSGNISISGGGSKNIWYATCSTAASTIAKVVSTTSSDFELTTGNMLRVLFTYANSASAPTLTVDSKTAKSVRVVRETSGAQYHWQAGETVDFVYDGTYFLMVDRAPATTTYYGPTKLSSSTSSTSTSLAATPSAVKSAYDLANTANTAITGGGISSSLFVTEAHDLFASTSISGNGHKYGTVDFTKTGGYYPISIAGWNAPDAVFIPSRLRLSAQGLGTATVAYDICNPRSSSQTSKFIAYILWLKTS